MYQITVDTAPIGIIIVRDFKILMLNTIASKFLGFTKDELIGKSVMEFIPEHLQDEISQRMKNREAGLNEPTRYELELIRKDKSISTIELFISVIDLMDGPATLAFTTDISDNIKSKNELKESEEKYRDLVETSQDLIWQCDTEGKFTYLNPAWEEILGYSLEEMLGRKFTDFKNQTEVENEYKAFLDRLNNDTTLKAHETQYFTKDGQELTLILNAIPLKNIEGEVIGRQGTAIDVTRNKELEQNLHLAQKMETVGRLTRGIAHDFNNLLHIIQGHCEILLNQNQQKDEVQEDIRQILSAAESGAELVNQLVSFSKGQELKIESLDLNNSIKSINSIIKRGLTPNVEIKFGLADNLYHVDFDPSQVQLIVMNMVINAKEAMPNGGKLMIETKNEKEFVVLSIKDNGVGIDKMIRERIFEPYFTTKKNRSGLGLTTVYGIINQCNGHIRVESILNQGSTFEIYLPRSTSQKS